MTRLSPNTRRVLRTLLPLALVLVLAACAGDAELDTRAGLEGPEAREIESFLSWVLWIAYAVFAGVMGVTIYAYVKFRIRTDDYEDDEFPPQIHGNEKLEYTWTAIPAILLVIIAGFTLVLHNEINSDDDNPITVTVAGEQVEWEPQVVVLGQQWWWEYQYHFTAPSSAIDQKRPETLPTPDIITATQMVIPVGEEIELEITSRDVIHSFWIPSLNGKRDAVPGRQAAPWKLQADSPGVYFGQCTEFCGLSHSRMRMQVVAMERPEFDAWVAEQMQPYSLSDEDAAFVDAVASGEPATPANSTQRAINTFRTKCASCHLMEGITDNAYFEEDVANRLVAGAAPNLTHFASRTTFAGGIRNVWDPETGAFNANDLRIWLQDPSQVKANYTDPVPDEFDENGEPIARLRGMPNLELTTQEIDDLVALLEAAGTKPSSAIIAATGVENEED